MLSISIMFAVIVVLAATGLMWLYYNFIEWLMSL